MARALPLRQRRRSRGVIVVPRGNNPEKRAIEGYGAKLLVEGDDFVESLRFAEALAQRENLHWVPSYHQD